MNGGVSMVTSSSILLITVIAVLMILSIELLSLVTLNYPYSLIIPGIINFVLVIVLVTMLPHVTG